MRVKLPGHEHTKAELIQLLKESVNEFFACNVERLYCDCNVIFSEAFDKNNHAIQAARESIMAIMMYRLGEMDAMKRLQEGGKSNE